MSMRADSDTLMTPAFPAVLHKKSKYPKIACLWFKIRYTLPETNIALKIDGWKTILSFSDALFSGEAPTILVSHFMPWRVIGPSPPFASAKVPGLPVVVPRGCDRSDSFQMSRQKLSPLYSDAMWAVKKHHHFDSDCFVWIYFVWRCKEIERGRQEMRAKIDYFSIGGVF